MSRTSGVPPSNTCRIALGASAVDRVADQGERFPEVMPQIVGDDVLLQGGVSGGSHDEVGLPHRGGDVDQIP